MSIDWKPWLEYNFEFGLPPEQADEFIARLAQTPTRLTAFLSGGAADLTVRPGTDKWSVLEHAGHLFAVEQLWEIRFKEFAEGNKELYPAEMSGRSTFEAKFNEMESGKILEDFRVRRENMLEYLRGFEPDYFARRALHPRLQKIISPVDLLYFIDQHDNHHLTKIQLLLQ